MANMNDKIIPQFEPGFLSKLFRPVINAILNYFINKKIKLTLKEY